jgi:hypothetical protein
MPIAFAHEVRHGAAAVARRDQPVEPLTVVGRGMLLGPVDHERRLVHSHPFDADPGAGRAQRERPTGGEAEECGPAAHGGGQCCDVVDLPLDGEGSGLVAVAAPAPVIGDDRVVRGRQLAEADHLFEAAAELAVTERAVDENHRRSVPVAVIGDRGAVG